MVEKLVTYLGMASPDLVRPAAPVRGLEVVRLGDPAGADGPRIRLLHEAVARPHHWSSLERPDERWKPILADERRSHWVATVNGLDIGWSCLALDDTGVEIVSFGLRPEAIGKGLGGAFLTEVVRQAWRLLEARTDGGGRPAGSVWLHTASWDHPHALGNYLARGFTVERLERQEQFPDRDERPSTPVQQAPRFLVRPAVAADAEAVAGLIDHLGNALPVATARERLARLASSPDDIIAVAVEHGSDVVGVVSAHMVPMFAEDEPGFMRITALSVDSRRARNGIGARLVGFVEYVARRRGIDLIEVSSGQRPEREATHALHRES